MTQRHARAIFKRLCECFGRRGLLPSGGVRLHFARHHFLRHPQPRDFAWYEPGKREVWLTLRALEQPVEVIAGLLAHELGHAAAQVVGEAPQAERQADALANFAVGCKIRYNASDVQTLGDGRSPRPKWLPQ